MYDNHDTGILPIIWIMDTEVALNQPKSVSGQLPDGSPRSILSYFDMVYMSPTPWICLVGHSPIFFRLRSIYLTCRATVSNVNETVAEIDENTVYGILSEGRLVCKHVGVFVYTGTYVPL